MVYLQRQIGRHEYSTEEEGATEFHTCFASIRYWNGRDWGPYQHYKCNEHEAFELTVEEAENLVCAFYDAEDESEAYYSHVEYFIVEQASAPTQEDWERLY